MMGAEVSSATKLDSDAVERRERRPVSLRALIIRKGGVTSDVQVLDLSYEGCGLETPVELYSGEGLKLSVLNRGAINAHVRWCRDGRAGLIFDPEPQKRHWPRRSARAAVRAEVSLRRLGQSSYRVNVTDLSPEGCKLGLVERPRVGEQLFVKLDGLEALDAEVCWVDGHVAGLRFERTIHPAVFDLLLQRLR
jgi:hypothetical protein